VPLVALDRKTEPLKVGSEGSESFRKLRHAER
jgi:hypothetical protein